MVIFSVDGLLTSFCLDVQIHSIILEVHVYIYVIVVYIAAISHGIDKKVVNLICFVHAIIFTLQIMITFLPYLGLEMLFGYAVILFDAVIKKILFIF